MFVRLNKTRIAVEVTDFVSTCKLDGMPGEMLARLVQLKFKMCKFPSYCLLEYVLLDESIVLSVRLPE